MTTNTYDKKDMVRRNSVLIAGPLKIGEYQVRDPETLEWSEPQFHMTYDNMVMAVMEKNAATLFADFINRALGPVPFTSRVTELLEANNRYLERARDAERRLNEANLTIALLQGDSAVKVGA